MKKIFLLALVVLMSSAINAGTAAKKKVKAKAPVASVPLSLKTSSDSLSYAAGMSVTNSLAAYLKQQFGVDSASMPKFIAAFQESINATGNKDAQARIAGYQIASQVSSRMLPGLKGELKDSGDSVSTALFYRGFTDALKADYSVMKFDESESFTKSRMEALHKAKNEKLYGANRKAGEDFLASNAKKDSVVTLPDGLQYKILVKGNGPVPKATDEISAKYEGRLVDGRVFDGSAKHGKGEPIKFRCNQVIKGWTEALTMMPVGSKWEIYIPQQLAYGEQEQGMIKPYSALVFTLELVSIEGQKPAVTPADAKATSDSSAKATKTKGKKKDKK